MGLFRRLLKQSDLIALNPHRLVRAWKGLFLYLADKREFYAQYLADPERSLPPGKLSPRLTDRFDAGGVSGGHYFHQDLLVAQMVFRTQARRHIDVGSRVDGFVAHIAAFRQIDVFDIRHLSTTAANIRFFQKDLMRADPSLVECTDSLSCLHALEHFGLGRYGDAIDYRGYQKGLEMLARMLEPGGRLYLSLPIGRHQRFEFNAHRVFSLSFLMELYKTLSLGVENFSYVDDAGELHVYVDLHSVAANRTFDLDHGCGIFTLRKPLRGDPTSS